MARKYLNKKSNLSKKKSQLEEDEWSHISDSEIKLDDKDIEDIDSRTVFLDSQEQDRTHWEKAADATKETIEKTGDTGQYIKYVNDYLGRKNIEIQKVKNLKKKFDEELSLLDINQNIVSIGDSEREFNKEDILKIRNDLELENNLRKDYLNKLKQEVTKTEKAIQKQETKIKQLDQKISSKIPKAQDVKSLEEQLISLANEYDFETIVAITSSLVESKKKNHNKS